MEPNFTLQRKDKVAIIGCADSKTQAPYQEYETWEFWGVNNLHLSIPQAKAAWSRWFELHTITQDSVGRYLRRGKYDFRGQPVDQYLKSINSMGIPIYMQDICPIVTNGVIYPREMVLNKFGRYFTNTISWMIALALLDGFKTIGIYGVDMAVSSPLRGQNEYSFQRPSCEYFVGLARGLGVEVIIPETCDLLKTNFLYGFEEHKEEQFNAKLIEMDTSMAKRQGEAESQLRVAEQKLQQYIGARAAISEIKKIRSNF